MRAFVKPARLAGASSRLALGVKQVIGPGSASSKLGATSRTNRARCCATAFTLMTQQIAEGRELPPIAAVLPALGLRLLSLHLLQLLRLLLLLLRCWVGL